MACCPVHDDHNPSLSIEDGDGGEVLVHCHAGCSSEDVISKLHDLGLWPGRRSKDRKRRLTADSEKDSILLPVPEDAPPPNFDDLLGGEPSEIWTYCDAEGRINHYICRIQNDDGSKSFRPVTYWRTSNGPKWLVKAFPAPTPLYGLPQLAALPDKPVLVVEGEKAADAAQEIFSNINVITWSGGSKAAHKADWSALAGRDVTIWSDADEAGEKAAEEVAKQLVQVAAASIKKVILPESLPPSWDLADAAPAGFDVRAALSDAENYDPTLARYILTGPELQAFELPKRDFIIDSVLPTQSLSMIYGERGIGKTWATISLGLSVAHGSSFFGYEVAQCRRVLHIDGEMALSDIKERITRLCPNPPENFMVLSSELLYLKDEPLNLNDEADQKRIIDTLQRLGQLGISPELLVFDNLSSLSTGIDENDNSALDAQLKFFLQLRHSGYSALLVHHAGKSGQQRGASRREDLLDLSIHLSRPDRKATAPQSHHGAHCILEFAKVRGRPPPRSRLDLKLSELSDGRLEWLVDDAPDVGREDEVLQFIALEEPNKQAEIAKHFGFKAPRASQICRALKDAGLLSEQGLSVTEEGRRRLLTIWPDLSERLDVQDDIPFQAPDPF